MSRVKTWIIGLLKGIFPTGHAWAIDLIAGLTHGAFRGVVEAKNKPRGVRVYGTTPERIEEVYAKIADYRNRRADRARGDGV